MKKTFNFHNNGLVVVIPPGHELPEEIDSNNLETLRKAIIECEISQTQTLYAPITSSNNGTIAPQSQFHIIDNTISALQIYSGVEAGGCIIPKGSAAVFKTKDDPVVVFSDPVTDTMMAVRTGVPSLIDLGQVFEGKPSRRHFSVIDSAIETLTAMDDRIAVENLIVSLHTYIRWKYFTHPFDEDDCGIQNQVLVYFLRDNTELYGPKVARCKLNKNYIDQGHIDLGRIIIRQLKQLGISRANIYKDGIDTGPSRVPDDTTRVGKGHLEKDNPYASVRRGSVGHNLIFVNHYE